MIAMRRLLLTGVFALAATGCGGSNGQGLYSENDLELVTGFTAKETCSCLFVIGQTEDYCRAWTVQSPEVTTWTADYSAKTVLATALTFWGARARFTNSRDGCLLE